MVVWTLALFAPQRVAGVVGMSVPFLARGEVAPIANLRSVFADSFFYMLYFQEPGVADADLAADPARTMRRLLAAPATGAIDPAFFAADGRGFVERIPEPNSLPSWLCADELDYYIEEFRRTGFTGGLNWYRNLDRNWLLTAGTTDQKITVPSLFIGGAQDPVLTLSPPSVMDGWLLDHRGTVIVEGAGHWVQQERPAEVNAALMRFVADL
jgi:pimeloyl-ACP methyl ester carboxylesterase